MKFMEKTQTCPLISGVFTICDGNFAKIVAPFGDNNGQSPICLKGQSITKTRSSADADNRLDAFSGQSRSTNMLPFHM